MTVGYCTLIREETENAEKWMGNLRVKADEYEYKERDRRIKDQFINGINDDEIMIEIIKGVTAIKNTNEIPSDKAFR